MRIIIFLLPMHLIRYLDFITLKKKSDYKTIGKITIESNSKEFESIEDELNIEDKKFIVMIFEILSNLIETLKTIQIDKLSKREDFKAFAGLGYCPNILLSAWIWLFWLSYDLVINDLLGFNDNGIYIIIEKGLFQSILFVFIVAITYLKSESKLMLNKKFINLLFSINIILFLLPLNYLRINDNYQIKDNDLIEIDQINELIKGSDQDINRIKFIAFQILRVFLFYVIFIIIEINHITKWKLNKLSTEMVLPQSNKDDNNQDNLNKTEIQIKIIQTFWILFISNMILLPCVIGQLIILISYYINYTRLIKKHRYNFKELQKEVVIEKKEPIKNSPKKKKRKKKPEKNYDDFKIDDFF